VELPPGVGVQAFKKPIEGGVACDRGLEVTASTVQTGEPGYRSAGPILEPWSNAHVQLRVIGSNEGLDSQLFDDSRVRLMANRTKIGHLGNCALYRMLCHRLIHAIEPD
jgi:hypothetical protein